MQKQYTHTHTENSESFKTLAFEILCEVSNIVLIVCAHLNLQRTIKQK